MFFLGNARLLVLLPLLVLLAMGFDEITASSAIRVSMGPTTTEAEVMAFADAWIEAYRRRKARAA